MSGAFLNRWRAWLAVACAAGLVRIGYFYLVHEPLADAGEEIGTGYASLRPLVSQFPMIGYLPDEPLDADPAVPRDHGFADMMYAWAQYALAPTILAYGDATSPVVLANFRDPRALERAIASGGYVVLARPREGIALLRPR